MMDDLVDNKEKNHQELRASKGKRNPKLMQSRAQNPSEILEKCIFQVEDA
jgi:hypothetical protein